MILASVFENIGGVKTIILILLAAVIAVYLRSLSRREKKEAAAEKLTAEQLASLPDDQLVNKAVGAMLAACESAKKDPYRMVADWSNPQVNVYSVWVTVKEMENGSFADLVRSPSGQFLPLAADGFAQIGAPECEAAARAAADMPDGADEAFRAALAAEQPLTLCASYIRDNVESFAEE